MFPFDVIADRRRPEVPDFADTVPACFRSEAFVEDLDPAPALQVMTGPMLRLPIAA